MRARRGSPRQLRDGMSAQVVVETHLSGGRSRRQLEHLHPGAARGKLLAEGVDGLQQIGPRPHVGIGDENRVAAVPVHPIQITDGAALVAPAPETAEADAGQALLIGAQRFLLTFGEVNGHRGRGEGGLHVRRQVEPRRGAGRLVVAHGVPVPVRLGREELGAIERVGARIRKDEDVADVVGQPRAQQARQVTGSRREESGRPNSLVGEARGAQIGESVGVQIQRGRHGQERMATALPSSVPSPKSLQTRPIRWARPPAVPG